jgi:phenol hydroxylase P2 protein
MATKTQPTTKARPVGVHLQDNDENRSVVDAIEQDNPDVAVKHMPGLVELQTVGQLVVRRATVESKLGRPWETHEFQMAIVSYIGHIAQWDEDEIVIRWDH